MKKIKLSDEEKIVVLSALLHDFAKPKSRYSGKAHHIEGFESFIKIIQSNPAFSKFLSKENLEKVALIIKHHHEIKNHQDDISTIKKLLDIVKSGDHIDASSRRTDRDEESLIINIGRDDNLVLPKSRINVPLNEAIWEKSSPKEEKLFDLVMGALMKINYGGDDFNFLNKIKNVLHIYYTFVQSQKKMKDERNNWITVSSNISLYTHLNSVAAVSYVLHKFNEAGCNDIKFLWVSGHLDGIQRFIFNKIKSEGTDEKASKRMRGRSFFVVLLTKFISEYIARELNLPPTNIISVTSSSFVILVPDLPIYRDKLNELRGLINNSIWRRYKPLYLNLFFAKLKLEGNNLYFEKDLDQYMRESYKERYKELDLLYKENNGNQLCEFCGVNLAEEGNKCHICKMMEAIGGEIPKNNFIFFDERGKHYIEFDNKKFNFGFSNGVNSDQGWLLLSPSFIKNDLGKIVSEVTDLMYVNNYIYKDGEFSEIGDNKINGENKLLLLFKIDIDRLGDTINYILSGFEWGRKSGVNYKIAQYHLFSELVNIFVTLELGYILDGKRAYVVFAGGDDISIVVSPKEGLFTKKNILMEFIDRFNKFFNHKLTFSAGAYVFDESYPLSRAIENAEILLKKSKHSGKNRITFFHQRDDNKTTVGVWEGKNRSVMNINEIDYQVNNLMKYLKGSSFSISLLHKLNELRESKEFSRFNINIPTPLIKYYIFRNLPRDIRDSVFGIIINNWEYYPLIYMFLILAKKIGLLGGEKNE